MRLSLQYLSPLIFVVMLWCFDDRIAYTVKELHQWRPRTPVLSAVPIQVGELVSENKLLDFRLSPKIAAKTWDHYQTVTYVWPIKFEDASHHAFLFRSENVPAGCSKVAEKSEVILVQCE